MSKITDEQTQNLESITDPNVRIVILENPIQRGDQAI